MVGDGVTEGVGEGEGEGVVFGVGLGLKVDFFGSLIIGSAVGLGCRDACIDGLGAGELVMEDLFEW